MIGHSRTRMVIEQRGTAMKEKCIIMSQATTSQSRTRFFGLIESPRWMYYYRGGKSFQS